MLKRLRPASPPPSEPSIPLISEPPRHSKRRRILPPSLDGQSRHTMLRTDEDDGDGEEDEGEINVSDGNNSGPSVLTGSNTEYESANTVLHDLHALHRHRLIFSSPLPSFVHSGHHYSPHSPDKTLVTSLPHYPLSPDAKDMSGRPDFRCQLPSEEVQSVKERYEDTNRLLGSLFLNRRKQLDPENT
ncbi:hypothetical protein B0H15DRAFT_813431 [Mycena belliarum]|uniref:Uncharacterized protein n=1 Tax=Mycena belliarum TaxID=1033014 RepID=A0AAD6UGP7_9AGAR|nr:hypothetical protein B0H15DRAFT_813431 [Mycena belliae]